MRSYKYDRLCILSVPNIKSHIKIKQYDLDYFFNFDKDLELLDLSLSNEDISTNFFLEKRIYHFSYKFTKDIFIKKVNFSSVTEKTKRKLFLMREEIINESEIQQNGLPLSNCIPTQLKSILNSRPDLVRKKLHLEENEELLCRWLIKHGFKEYPSLLDDLGDKNEFLIWLNSKRKNDKLSRLNLAIFNTNKIFRKIWNEKNFKSKRIKINLY